MLSGLVGAELGFHELGHFDLAFQAGAPAPNLHSSLLPPGAFDLGGLGPKLSTDTYAAPSTVPDHRGAFEPEPPIILLDQAPKPTRGINDRKSRHESVSRQGRLQELVLVLNLVQEHQRV
jgi:hypothetical protein